MIQFLSLIIIFLLLLITRGILMLKEYKKNLLRMADAEYRRIADEARHLAFQIYFTDECEKVIKSLKEVRK